MYMKFSGPTVQYVESKKKHFPIQIYPNAFAPTTPRTCVNVGSGFWFLSVFGHYDWDEWVQ